MDTLKRNRVWLVGVALILSLVLAWHWQTIRTWFSPVPVPHLKLSLAVTNYPGSGLPYLAQAKGYFAQEGLDVTLMPYTSGRDALRAGLEKQADLAAVADMPVMYAMMNRQPVSIVATIFTAGRAHGVLARRDRGIATLADLKGKTIAVTFGSDGHFVLSAMLARYRLDLSQIRTVNLPPEEMQTALQNGTIDAISTWEPWLSAARRSLGTEGLEFRSDSGFVVNYNLAGRTDWIAANPDKTQSLLRALLRAKRFVDEQPQVAHAMMVALMNLEPGTFGAGKPHYRFVVQLEQNLLILLEDQARWAIQNKFSDQTAVPNFLSAIDMNALTAVQSNAVKIVP